MSKRELPHDPEIEQRAIGYILLTEGDCMSNEMYDVTVESFYMQQNKELFQCCDEVLKSSRKVDLFLLITHLRSIKRDDALRQHAVAAAGSVVIRSGMEDCVEKLRLLKTIRSVAKLGHEAWASAHQPTPLTTENVNALVTRVQSSSSTLDEATINSDVKVSASERARTRIQAIRDGKNTSLKTGIDVYDKLFGGMQRGIYTGIAARQGIGKSVLMEQIAESFMARGIPVCIFSQDMAPSMLIERMACRMCNLSKWDLDNGRLTKAEIAQVLSKIDEIEGSSLRLQCIEILTPESVIAAMRSEFIRYGCLYYGLDHFGHFTGHAREEPRLTIRRASSAIRGFINKRNAGFFGLAHLNRSAANGRPGPEHVKECDDVLGDCDELLLMWRDQEKEDEYKASEVTPVTFTVGKNRNGPKDEHDCLFEKRTMTFVNE